MQHVLVSRYRPDTQLVFDFFGRREGLVIIVLLDDHLGEVWVRSDFISAAAVSKSTTIDF